MIRRGTTLAVSLIAAIVSGLAVNGLTSSVGIVIIVTLIVCVIIAGISLAWIISDVDRAQTMVTVIELLRSGKGGANIGTPEQRLLATVGNIEYECNRLLYPTGSADEDFSVFRMRAEMKDRGAWSDDDVRTFDEVTRIRNALVHGDYGALSDQDVESALTKARRLRSRIRTAER